MVNKLQESHDNTRRVISEITSQGWSKHIPLSSKKIFKQIEDLLTSLNVDFRTFDDNSNGVQWGHHIFIKPEDARTDLMRTIQKLKVDELSTDFPDIAEEVRLDIDTTVN